MLLINALIIPQLVGFLVYTVLSDELPNWRKNDILVAVVLMACVMELLLVCIRHRLANPNMNRRIGGTQIAIGSGALLWGIGAWDVLAYHCGLGRSDLRMGWFLILYFGFYLAIVGFYYHRLRRLECGR